MSDLVFCTIFFPVESVTFVSYLPSYLTVKYPIVGSNGVLSPKAKSKSDYVGSNTSPRDISLKSEILVTSGSHLLKR